LKEATDQLKKRIDSKIEKDIEDGIKKRQVKHTEEDFNVCRQIIEQKIKTTLNVGKLSSPNHKMN
jgi:hypothetical protein